MSISCKREIATHNQCAYANPPVAYMMEGRRALRLVDNTTAVSIVNTLHLIDAGLRVDAWYKWVPSAASISDLPSRDPSTWSAQDSATMATFRALETHCRRDIEIPPASALDSPSATAMFAAALVGGAALDM
jgi:hypothetical protein